MASVGGGRITNICGLDSCNDDVVDDPPLGGERNTALHWSLCIWPRTAQQVRTNETRADTLALSEDHVIFGGFLRGSKYRVLGPISVYTFDFRLVLKGVNLMG